MRSKYAILTRALAFPELAIEVQTEQEMKTAVSAPTKLAALRHQKGISLSQIAATTKIGVRYLEAIECGQFAKLPGGFYNVSYIRQYARAIEVSEAELLERYLQSVPIS